MKRRFKIQKVETTDGSVMVTAKQLDGPDIELRDGAKLGSAPLNVSFEAQKLLGSQVSTDRDLRVFLLDKQNDAQAFRQGEEYEYWVPAQDPGGINETQ